MKFTILKQKNKEEEKEIKLFLEQNTGGYIRLRFQDNEGRKWTLMNFENGRFERASDIPSNLGIQLNEIGEILEIK